MFHINEKNFNSHSQLRKDNLSQRINGEVWHDVRQRKSSNILIANKACGLKTSQTIIYVKGYFNMFFCILKDTILSTK